ncbi:MAG TPA: fatty acid desaturase [Dongiaceae bacterium]|nr:fatty acid desaturase [Dongiaceae bacterium]
MSTGTLSATTDSASPDTSASKPAISQDDAAKSLYIRREVTRKGDELRARFPILRREYENLLAVTVMVASLAGMMSTGWLYVADIIPAWLAIPLAAIFASLIHELEHDLIHWMYFRKKLWAHHLMLAIGLAARPTTVRPWVRRAAHLNHHQNSGTEEDIEERAITNGQHWGLLRLIMLIDLPFTILMHTLAQKGWRQKLWYVGYVGGALFPQGIVAWSLWYICLGFHLANVLLSPVWSETTLTVMHYVDIAVVVWVAPNILRTFCLNFMSSNMHYYGDIERGNVIQETQVLNAWWLFPLQLFSFNVGATHGIHHFVVREPFWIRQMTMKTAHRVMKECGVRFNDFGSFSRANRWSAAQQPEPVIS